MELKKIKIKNVRSIENLTQEFKDGSSIWLVAGDNEIGKSTLLESITALITGNFENKDYITRNEEKGYIEGDFRHEDGDVNVKMYLKKGTPPSVEITYPKGDKSKSINELRALFGNYIDIDPDRWLDLGKTEGGKREQIETVKKLLPNDKLNEIDNLEEKYNDLQPESEDAWNNRVIAQKILKEEAKEIIKKLGAEHIIEAETEEEVEDLTEEIRSRYSEAKDVETISSDMTKAIEEGTEYSNAESLLEKEKEALGIKDEIIIDQNNPNYIKYAETSVVKGKEVFLLKTKHDSVDGKLTDKLESIKKKSEEKIKEIKLQCEKDIKGLEKQASGAKESYLNSIKGREIQKTQIETNLKNANSVIKKKRKYDMTSLKEQSNDITLFNENCKLIERFDNRKKAFEDSKGIHAEIREEINTLKQKREEIIKSCDLPIKELSFDNEGLYFDGEPYLKGNVSTSQNMRCCVTLSTVLNPEVPIFKIQRGESIGSLWDVIEAYTKEYKKKTGKNINIFAEKMEQGQDEIKIQIYEEGIILNADKQPDLTPISMDKVRKKRVSRKKNINKEAIPVDDNSKEESLEQTALFGEEEDMEKFFGDNNENLF